MIIKKLWMFGFLDALGTIIYIALVATVMSNANRWFGGPDIPILTPIAVLSLLVLSAAIVGALVLGRPVMRYLDGQKSEAVKLFLYTIAWLFGFTAVIFIILASLPKPNLIY